MPLATYFPCTGNISVYLLSLFKRFNVVVNLKPGDNALALGRQTERLPLQESPGPGLPGKFSVLDDNLAP